MTLIDSFAPYLTLHRIPPGRAVRLLRELLDLLGAPAEGEAPGRAQLRLAVRDAIDSNGLAFRRRRQLQDQQAGGKARGQAALLDPQINEAVKALFDLMTATSRGAGDDDSEAALARQVLSVAFPRGVAPIVQVQFDTQVSTVDELLALFAETGTLHHVVEPLRLGRRLERLTGLNRQFEAELKGSPALTASAVDAAFRAGQQALHRVFVGILWTYGADSPQDLAERTRLAAPILIEDSRLGEQLRRNRRTTDLNPDTGNEVESEPAEPTPPNP